MTVDESAVMRCVSSATPISAAQRKELWGTALHHSFEKKNTSASSDSLYNSCTDLDTEENSEISEEHLNTDR
ncbi:unnamed protein product [Nippostrongylus brasiliensis]|uniref:DUF4817 domain-containing protein n=1 Tax=Nippostrongylus brasiliensis TaxID=27835 RepID=A0A0N4XDI5_NIPBR|nr:unnamed protein product [Nippostrongylus brasiliensis]